MGFFFPELQRFFSFFCLGADRGGQIKAGEVITSLPKSAGIGLGGDVGVAGSEAK